MEQRWTTIQQGNEGKWETFQHSGGFLDQGSFHTAPKRESKNNAIPNRTSLEELKIKHRHDLNWNQRRASLPVANQREVYFSLAHLSSHTAYLSSSASVAEFCLFLSYETFKNACGGKSCAFRTTPLQSIYCYRFGRDLTSEHETSCLGNMVPGKCYTKRHFFAGVPGTSVPVFLVSAGIVFCCCCACVCFVRVPHGGTERTLFTV